MQIRVAFEAIKGLMAAKTTPLLPAPEILYSGDPKRKMGFGPGKERK